MYFSWAEWFSDFRQKKPKPPTVAVESWLALEDKYKYINTINVSIMNTFEETSQIPGIAVYAIDISNKYRTLLIGCILVGPSGSVILYKRRQNLPQSAVESWLALEVFNSKVRYS